MIERGGRIGAAMLGLALAVAGVGTGVRAQAQAQLLAQSGGDAAAPVPAGATAPGGVAPAGSAAYRLGIGDRIRVATYNEPSLSGEFQIGGDGSISFPLVGSVPVRDKTASEVEALLAQRLAGGYLLNPRVSVEVLNFRPFFLLGEVERPGRYPTFEGMTIQRAIATAGGFTYRANRKTVMVRHQGDATEHKVKVDDDMLIVPGDVVRIGERYF